MRPVADYQVAAVAVPEHAGRQGAHRVAVEVDLLAAAQCCHADDVQPLTGSVAPGLTRYVATEHLATGLAVVACVGRPPGHLPSVQREAPAHAVRRPS